MNKQLKQSVAILLICYIYDTLLKRELLDNVEG